MTAPMIGDLESSLRQAAMTVESAVRGATALSDESLVLIRDNPVNDMPVRNMAGELLILRAKWRKQGGGVIAVATSAEIDLALAEIAAAYGKARAKHSPMRSPHEGYAVLLEEVDELWEEVKRWQPDDHNAVAMRKEALHVAAMALAFLLEAAPDATGPEAR